MSHLVDWFSDDHFDRIFWKPSDMVWIGWVDPEEWMHSSYRTSSKHFTPLYRNYIEQKQNISIVCSFQINIMIVLTIYILHICTNNILHIHINHPFAPDMLTPPSPPHRVSPTTWVSKPCHSCHSIEQWFGRRSIRNILASRAFSTTARLRAVRLHPDVSGLIFFFGTPRKHPRKEKKS